MATNLGELFYSLRIKDLTQQDIDAINTKLRNLGSNIQIDPQAFKTAAQNAANGAPVDIKVRSIDLQNAANAATASMTGLRLKVDDTELARQINTILANNPNLAKAPIGADPAELRRSITAALQGHQFPVQIRVMRDQARAAVQNALSNLTGGSNVSVADTRKLLNLETANLRNQQAELAKVRAAHLQARDAANAHAHASLNLGGAMGSNIRIAGELGAAMASLYSIHAAKQFLAQIVEIGGELEHQRIALDTIYGDPGKTATLFGQIKGLARNSPFGVMDLTKNIKQLSAYGVAYNEVYDTAKRLADISAATSVDINRLILAFGKTKNRTFLDGLEAKQFAYANIPIYDALSKKLTELEGKFVSVKDVMGRIKKREIGFDMVKEILWDMTDEGGKFYNMQEKLAGSVKTSWKLVRDNIELMFGELAEGKIGEWLKGLAQMLQGATRNWAALGTVMMSIAGVWGLQRLAAFGLGKAVDAQTKSVYANLVAAKQKQVEEARAAAITGQLSQRQRELLLSTNRLTAAEIEQAMANGQLDATEVKRLYLSGQISRATMAQLYQMNALTAAEYRAATGSNVLAGAWIKLKAGMAGISSSFAAAGAMIFNWTTAIMGAVAAVAYLWQKNSAETTLGNDINKEMADKGEGMAKSLKDALAKPFEGLGGPQAQTLIDEYKNLIKDYAALPEDVIGRAIYDEHGKIRGTAEQIEYLRKELEALRGVAEKMEGSEVLGNAISGTGDGWFREDTITNLKDWSNSYTAATATYQKFVTENKSLAKEIVESAKNASPGFAKAVKDIDNVNDAFQILAHNRGEFEDAWASIYTQFGDFVTKGGSFWESLKIWNPTVNLRQNQETVARNTALAQAREAAESIKTAMGEVDMSLEQNKERVRQYFNEYTQQWGEKNEFLIKQAASQWEGVFGDVKLVPDDAQEKWKNEILSFVNKSADESTKEALKVMKIVGYDNMPESMKSLVDKAFDAAEDEAKEKLPDLYASNQQWMNEHPYEWRVNFYMDHNGGALSQPIRDLIDSVGGMDKLSFSTLELLEDISKDDQTMYEFRNALQKERQNAKNEMDAALAAGLDKTSETYKKAKEQYDVVETAIKELGQGDLLTKDQKSNKQDKKDPLLDGWKQRLKDLKDAWNEYKKWEKSVGDDAAAETVADSGLFGDMKAEDIPRTAEEYKKAIEKIKDELQTVIDKGGSTPQRESLLNEMLKTLLDVKKTIVDEQIEKALAVVDEEIERKLEEWNLYEKIRKATGNKELAFAFTFGLEGGGQTDYIELVKENFNAQIDAIRDTLDERLEGELRGKALELDFDMVTRDNYLGLPKELQKAWETAVKNIKKYQQEQRQFVADLLGEYQSAQQEIIAIQESTAETIAKIRNQVAQGFLTQLQGDNLIQKVQTNADYEIFKKSGDYLKFFNATLAISKQEINSIGKKIKDNLDKKLQSGVITAQEYCEEIEKINEVLKDSEGRMSNFVASLKGGLNGGLENAYKQQEAKYNKATIDYDKAKQLFDIAAMNNDQAGMDQAQAQMQAAQSEMEASSAAMEGMEGMMETVAIIDTIVHAINDTVQGITEAVNLMADMADSMGVDTSAGTSWGDAKAFFDAFSQASEGATKAWDSLKNGNIGGVISGVVQSITSWFTVFNRYHDAKLQKDIDESARAFEHLGNVVDRIEGKLKYFLGNRRNLEVDLSADEKEMNKYRMLAEWMYGAFRSDPGVGDFYMKEAEKYQKRIDAYETGGALGYERQLMAEQLEELERQKADYEQMKGDHKDDIEDVTQQIEEQKQAIRDFAEEMANVVYGIDLGGWASQIGDALVDAFANGEDAAEAFRDTVNDIMRDVVSNVITQNIIAPAMQDMQDWLFGKDGQGGAYGEDFWLDEANVAEMYSWLGSIEDAAERAWEFMENVDAMTDGKLKKTDDSDSAVRTGIQSVTEDTADLLASYVNAIRAYCAQNVLKIDTLVNESVPKLNLIAEGQLQKLTMIAENTRRNMEAAEAMRSSLGDVKGILERVTRGTSKFYVN